MRQKTPRELDRLVADCAGNIERTEKRTRCVYCNSQVTSGYMLTRPRKPGRICGNCVAAGYAKTLPAEASDWSPEEVCTMLAGDASARIKGISACVAFSERLDRFSMHWMEVLPLGESVEVFKGLLECAVFPGETRMDGMVRLLAVARLQKGANDHHKQKLITDISPADSAQLIKGAATVLGGVMLGNIEKIQWLQTFRDHPDPEVISVVKEALKALNVNSFEQAEEILELGPLINNMLNSFKADELKSLVATVQRVSGIQVPGTTKEVMATGLAQSLGRKPGMQTFYDNLSPALKKVVDYLGWQHLEIPATQVEEQTGICVVSIEKNAYRQVVRLNREFDGLLTCQTYGYDDLITISLHPWLKARLKPILPVPEKARLRGTEEPPDPPGSRLFKTETAFVRRLPALDAMCQQGVIPRKKNGDPTVAGLRKLQAAGWEIDEFYAGKGGLEYRRLETLIRLGDSAAFSPKPRTEPIDVLRAWLDALTKPVSAPGKQRPRTKHLLAPFHLLSFMTQFKAVSHSPADRDAAKVCLDSLTQALTSIPKGKWVTVQDLSDFLLYNDLRLPVPVSCDNATLSGRTGWGGMGKVYIRSDLQTHWEKPILRTLLVTLTAIGAMEAVVAPPQTAPDDDYLLTTDALKAVCLTPIGEWYFQDGPESCFEAEPTGEVILDERRLLIHLKGHNPVLQVALEQVALPLDKGFYRLDGGSFLKDCGSQAEVRQKVDTLKSLLPDVLPPIWEEFFERVLQRINPLTSVDFKVLAASPSPEFRQLLLADSTLRSLCVMAEGGRILVRAGDSARLKKRLRELGYFIDSF